MMTRTSSIMLLLASTALQAAGQAGGWYLVNESLVCTSICEQQNECNIVGGVTDEDIAGFCKQTTDDCADGVLSNGQRSYLFGGTNNGLLGTATFGSGPAHGNNGCPNNDDCNKSFRYLPSSMRYSAAPGYPNAYCESANIVINGHYNHLRTGSIIVKLPSVRRAGPG